MRPPANFRLLENVLKIFLQSWDKNCEEDYRNFYLYMKRERNLKKIIKKGDVLIMRHENLFNNCTKAREKMQDKQFELWMAQTDYEIAQEALNKAIAEDKRRKEEFLEEFDNCENYEDLIMYILDNQEEILELFYCELDQINYHSRQLDKEIAKLRNEQPKEPFKGAITEMKEIEAAAEMEAEEVEKND